jgi:hypothetical protein
VTGPYKLPGRDAGNLRHSGNPSWAVVVIIGGLCAWMTAGLALAQVDEQRTWPPAGRDIWCWVNAKTDFVPGQVEAVFKRAVDEEMAFLDPAFSATVFFARNIRLTKGKAGERKKYKDRPAKADDLRIETEWRTGYLNQYRGSSYCFIALAAIRSMDLHYLYLPDLRDRYPKVPEGRNWMTSIHAGSPYNFFFANEDTARSFINAVASSLKQREMTIPFSRFGLMWENVTPAQAADMGKPVGENVLITLVAVAGPAEQAGIRPLDAVLQVNGDKVKNFSHFSQLLDGIAPGTRASLILLRRLKDPDRFPDKNDWNTLTVEMEAR